MAAPVWATDLTDIYVGGAITNWTVVQSSGPAGLNQETDFFIEEPDCLSKNAWAGALKGAIFDNGSAIAVPTDGAVVVWGFYGATGSLEDKATGGFQIIAGDSVTVFYNYYLAGTDTLTFNSWVPYVVFPHDSVPVYNSLEMMSVMALASKSRSVRPYFARRAGDLHGNL